ncbi:MAG: type II toxin-antitoxin system RelE/ParE family toxin [Sediminibacterium magnilacihabitans]|jgi:proteic killer suppression protein|nr:type II toxin-antitoxin system RelE/ParE family toxin [Sediminibacterium magnilacihabitans]PQV60364.1 proteic killer suppression protein [Sediminibacterium magnilacihabitans]
MILSIQHKGLRDFWMKGNGARLPTDQLRKIKLILDILDAAETIEAVDFPGARLHALKGDLKGFWSVTEKTNWRIIFKFEEGNAYLVDYLDYH